MSLPRLYSLKELANLLGEEVTTKMLRREVSDGSLKAMRFSDSPNAKIFVAESDVVEYIERRARARQFAR